MVPSESLSRAEVSRTQKNLGLFYQKVNAESKEPGEVAVVDTGRKESWAKRERGSLPPLHLQYFWALDKHAHLFDRYEWNLIRIKVLLPTPTPLSELLAIFLSTLAVPQLSEFRVQKAFNVRDAS